MFYTIANGIKISGTVKDINGKSARNILEHILTGKQMDADTYDELYEKKVIAHNLKATKERIIDDLNGVMTDLQRKMMRILLDHLDELNAHIRELDDDIDNFMKPEEKQASEVIQDVTGIANTSAQAIYRSLARIWDGSLQLRTSVHGQGCAPGTMKAQGNASRGRPAKAMRC